MAKDLTGGCQCRRIRYRVTVDNDDAYLCHCKMCRHATGGASIAFVSVQLDKLVWETVPDWYRSSPIAERPFCRTCGTPLGFKFVEGATSMDITLGSFDDPHDFRPVTIMRPKAYCLPGRTRRTCRASARIRIPMSPIAG